MVPTQPFAGHYSDLAAFRSQHFNPIGQPAADRTGPAQVAAQLDRQAAAR
jgi:hypothetical protein